jgi:cell division protein FtsL
MSTVADAAPRRAAKARSRRTPFAGGVVGIALLAALLAGVVAVNVIVLRLNVRYDELGRERAQLQADVAQLKARLSSASANARIETMARDRLGLVPSDPSATTYVRLGAGR